MTTQPEELYSVRYISQGFDMMRSGFQGFYGSELSLEFLAAFDRDIRENHIIKPQRFIYVFKRCNTERNKRNAFEDPAKFLQMLSSYPSHLINDTALEILKNPHEFVAWTSSPSPDFFKYAPVERKNLQTNVVKWFIMCNVDCYISHSSSYLIKQHVSMSLYDLIKHIIMCDEYVQNHIVNVTMGRDLTIYTTIHKRSWFYLCKNPNDANILSRTGQKFLIRLLDASTVCMTALESNEVTADEYLTLCDNFITRLSINLQFKWTRKLHDVDFYFNQ